MLKKLFYNKIFKNIVRAILFGILGAIFSQLSFRIPGLKGAVSDAREIVFLGSLIFLPAWTYAILTGFITALGGPYDALFTTIVMHVVVAPLAWFLIHKIEKFHKFLFKAILWFVLIIGIYIFVFSSLFTIMEYFLGNISLGNIFYTYITFLKGVIFETCLTAIIVTMIFLIYNTNRTLQRVNNQLDIINHHQEKKNIEMERLNEELRQTNEELEQTNEELEQTNEELERTNEELALSNEELEKYNSELLSAEQKLQQTNLELMESRAKYYALFHNSSDAMFIIEDEKFHECNDAAVILFGYGSKEELLSHYPWEISPLKQQDGMDSRKKAKEFIKLAFDTGKAFFEWQHKRKNNEIFPAEVSLTAIFVGDKKLIYTIIRDVSERKRTDELLGRIQMMESIGTLAGGIAHNLNNTLSGITASISMIQMKKKDIKPKLLYKYIDLIKDSSLEAVNTVKQLVSLSKKSDFFKTQLSINVLLKELEDFGRASFDHSIIFKVNYPKKDILITGDHSQIYQVFLNILINSVHSMTIMRTSKEEYGGELTIDVNIVRSNEKFKKQYPIAHKDVYIDICISDTGVGIEKDIMNDIFTPFFTTKDKSQGTGLGLSMVYNTVTNHKGFVDLYSEPSIGTIFHVFLPCEDPWTDDERAKDIKNKNISLLKKYKGKILIIDDDSIILNLGKDILTEMGFSVLTASNGKDGIELFKKNMDIKTVVLDMSMPIKSGREVFIELKKLKENLIIIIFSGYKEDERINELINMGAAGFIEKPFTFESFSQGIDKILKKETIWNI